MFEKFQLHNRCASSFKKECTLGEYAELIVPPTAICPAVLERQRSINYPQKVNCFTSSLLVDNNFRSFQSNSAKKFPFLRLCLILNYYFWIKKPAANNGDSVSEWSKSDIGSESVAVAGSSPSNHAIRWKQLSFVGLCESKEWRTSRRPYPAEVSVHA